MAAYGTIVSEINNHMTEEDVKILKSVIISYGFPGGLLGNATNFHQIANSMRIKGWINGTGDFSCLYKIFEENVRFKKFLPILDDQIDKKQTENFNRYLKNKCAFHEKKGCNRHDQLIQGLIRIFSENPGDKERFIRFGQIYCPHLKSEMDADTIFKMLRDHKVYGPGHYDLLSIIIYETGNKEIYDYFISTALLLN